MRVHASPRTALGGNNPPRGYRHVCLECGDPYEGMRPPGTHPSGFCCPGHRTDWNNRRRMRGAELYDLVMAWRFQRDLAGALALWRLVCRLASAFRADDRQARAGRRSWRDPHAVIAERPWLRATTLQKRRER